jgi:hypothetical protein
MIVTIITTVTALGFQGFSVTMGDDGDHHGDDHCDDGDDGCDGDRHVQPLEKQ